MQEITLIAGIIGVVKAIKDNVPQVTGWVTLLLAVFLGATAGYLQLLGTPDMLTGVFIGVAAVGSMTVASAVGNK